MKHGTRRLVSLGAALTLLITCGISGLVLPASAAASSTETNLLTNGDFSGGSTGWILSSAATVGDSYGKDGAGLKIAVQNAAGSATTQWPEARPFSVWSKRTPPMCSRLTTNGKALAKALFSPRSKTKIPVGSAIGNSSET